MDASILLRTPAQVSNHYLNWAEERQKHPGIDFGCVLDNVIIPLRPGDMVGVLARPGHGKTSFMAYMAMREAMRIMRSGSEDEIVVFVSWEQAVEEIELFFQSTLGKYSSTDAAWGRIGMDTLRGQAVPRARLPIWTIGMALADANKPQPRMYMDEVLATIESIKEKYGKRVTLVLFDYIQIIPVRKGSRRQEQVSEAAIQVRETAKRVGAPIMVGVQASRDVDSRRQQVPEMHDAQWASAIEQVADKLLALWRPIRNLIPEEHPFISIGGRQYSNVPELFVIRLLKQRMAEGFGIWAVHFEVQTLTLRDYETRDLNNL